MNRLTVGDLLEGNRRPLKRGYQGTNQCIGSYLL